MIFYTYLVFILGLISCSQLPLKRSELKQSHLPLKKQLRPFISDGCSMFPEGTKTDKTRWLRCCIIHDYQYWKGGKKELKARADKKLFQCVKEQDNELVASAMYYGAKYGGSPVFETTYEWGYGWNYERGYIKANETELKYIKALSPKVGDSMLKSVNKDSLDLEIKKLPALVWKLSDFD